MYTNTNYKTKKALKAALLASERITTHQPGGMFPATRNGEVTLEGPHYPEPHRWYVRATLRDGIVVSVK